MKSIQAIPIETGNKGIIFKFYSFFEMIRLYSLKIIISIPHLYNIETRLSLYRIIH